MRSSTDAGVIGWQEAFTSDAWRRLFDTNVSGAQRVNRAVLPQMREWCSGLLVRISSILGRMVIPSYGPYSATKFALEAKAVNSRVEWSAFGIASVLVEPGGHSMELGRNLIAPSDSERTASYGPAAEAHQQAFASFEQVLTGPNALDPQHVADTVAGLVGLPRGKRPFRKAVDRLGLGQAVEPYNQAAALLQTQVYGAFWIADVLTLEM